MSLKIPAPNLLDRYPGYVRLMWRNKPEILRYRVRVADTLNNAYGNFNGVGGLGTYALFDVEQGTSHITKPILKRGLAPTSGNHRNQTVALYDPNEFFGAATQVPPDTAIAFVRDHVGTKSSPLPAFPGVPTNLQQSPIKIVPAPFHLSTFWPTLAMPGTAPTVAGVLEGDLPPDDSMQILVPPFARNMILTNVGAGDLLYSTDPSSPLITIPAGGAVTQMMGTVLSLCSTANPDFRLIIEFQTYGDQ